VTTIGVKYKQEVHTGSTVGWAASAEIDREDVHALVSTETEGLRLTGGQCMTLSVYGDDPLSIVGVVDANPPEMIHWSSGRGSVVDAWRIP